MIDAHGERLRIRLRVVDGDVDFELAEDGTAKPLDKLDPFHTPESRTHIIPGKRKFLFVYPFVKTRDWYLLPLDKRQAIMDHHIKVGNEFPSVKLNTTYSFGLDDQDFVVAFETESPGDFLDLVMKLRETESSKYTQRDTPIFTCVAMSVARALDALDGAATARGVPAIA